MARKIQQTNNIQELSTSLFSTLSDLKSGKVTPKEASAISSVSGKILSTLSLRMRYRRETKGRYKISELEEA